MASGENCAGFRRGDAPHIFFCLDKRKCAAPGTKENRCFLKTLFQYGRLSWARSHPAAPDLWCSYYARAAVVTLYQTSFGTLGTGLRVSLAWPLTRAVAGRWVKRYRSGQPSPNAHGSAAKRAAVGMRKPVPRVPAIQHPTIQMRRKHHSSSKRIAQPDRAK